ncbi:MAG: TetR/AcrR family transcriptional regulator [Actinobacteria bacterium]|nr:MAG: TetR/AcrR family transcriptional regulator [Actinomycetota bacterium]
MVEAQAQPNPSPDTSKVAARDRILDAAAELFGSRGYDAVSVAEIASAAGVSTALIYYHFADKESLLKDLFLRAGAVFEPLLESLDAGTGSARERLAEHVHAWAEAVLAHEDFIRLLIRPLVGSSGPLYAEVTARVAANIEALRRVISEGIESGEFIPIDPLLAAECLFALLHTRVLAGWLNADHGTDVGRDADDAAQFIVDVYIGGLVADTVAEEPEC